MTESNVAIITMDNGKKFQSEDNYETVLSKVNNNGYSVKLNCVNTFTGNKYETVLFVKHIVSIAKLNVTLYDSKEEEHIHI